MILPSNSSDCQGSSKRILIVDDEENMRHMLMSLLNNHGYAVDSAADGPEALSKVGALRFDIILCDIKMPKLSGMEFLKAAQPYIENSTVIMMSAYGTIDMAVEAMKLGAYDFISKPFKNDEIRLTIQKAEERDILKQENRQLKERIRKFEKRYEFGKMLAKSNAMQKVFVLASKVARYDTTVLVTGESGTGKELIARGIHYAGERSSRPWVPVNCGGIPENLLESELFGHVKGAFTGADRNKKGLFEEADGGTIFLDEIGELPLGLQVNLLRVLQESEIRPLGASQTKRIDVRVIAATSRKLAEEIKAGAFREDLFFRLNVMPIAIPPLRERSEDILPLCTHFIAQFNDSLGRRVEGIAPAAMKYLMMHTWPGNVRELENSLERAMILCDGPYLGVEDFSALGVMPTSCAEVGDGPEDYSLKKAQRLLEEKMIQKALHVTAGNRTRAAQLLEISHPSLLSKMKTYNIA
jgi:two-component system response regulator AtoC